MIVERDAGRNEFLEVTHPSKSGNRSFSSSEWQVAVLGPIVEVATDFLAAFISYVFYRGAIRSESVGDDHSWRAVSFHRFLQKGKCCLLVAGLGNVTFQHFTFMVDSSPEVVLDTIDLHENLIRAPLPLGVLALVGCTLRVDFSGEDWTKPVDPEPHAFMANINATLVEKIFNISQRKRKTNIHHHRELDNLRRYLK